MINVPRLIRLFPRERLAVWIPAVIVLLLAVNPAPAQSTDQAIPTAIRSADISAEIPVRDLGDPRLTRHFFIFSATPGDLLITVESKNLNGDVDIFTAEGMKPLVKITLFAESATGTTKGIYLRARQDMIMRVEARSPNDEPGTYRVRFGGSFEPFSGEVAGAESGTETETPTVASSSKGRPVTATGARIDQPAPVEEKPEQPVAEPSPSPAETTAANTTPPKSTRPNRPGRRNTRPARKPPAKPKPAETTSEAETAKPAETTPEVKPETQEPQAEIGPRLIIETKDGTRIERPMSTVRRVVVDNGQIIVLLKTGKIERVPMSTVLRMSIEP